MFKETAVLHSRAGFGTSLSASKKIYEFIELIKKTNCTTIYDYFLFLSSCQRALVLLFDDAKV